MPPRVPPTPRGHFLSGEADKATPDDPNLAEVAVPERIAGLGWLRAVPERPLIPEPPGGSILERTRAAFDALVDSPDHYANMTHADFNSIGIGDAVQGRDLWATQNFAHYP